MVSHLRCLESLQGPLRPLFVRWCDYSSCQSIHATTRNALRGKLASSLRCTEPMPGGVRNFLVSVPGIHSWFRFLGHSRHWFLSWQLLTQRLCICFKHTLVQLPTTSPVTGTQLLILRKDLVVMLLQVHSALIMMRKVKLLENSAISGSTK